MQDNNAFMTKELEETMEIVPAIQTPKYTLTFLPNVKREEIQGSQQQYK